MSPSLYYTFLTLGMVTLTIAVGAGSVVAKRGHPWVLAAASLSLSLGGFLVYVGTMVDGDEAPWNTWWFAAFFAGPGGLSALAAVLAIATQVLPSAMRRRRAVLAIAAASALTAIPPTLMVSLIVDLPVMWLWAPLASLPPAIYAALAFLQGGRRPEVKPLG